MSSLGRSIPQWCTFRAPCMQLLLMCVSRLSMASSNTFLRQKATAEWFSTYSANVPWPKVVWGQKTRQQQKTGIAPNLVLITIIITTTTITIIIIIMLFIMMLIIICITVSLWWEVHAPCWSPQSILISSRPHILNHHGYRSKLGTQIVRWFMSIHVNIHGHTWQYIC